MELTEQLKKNLQNIVEVRYMLSSEYCEAAVEVLGILNELEESEFNKIPKKL